MITKPIKEGMIQNIVGKTTAIIENPGMKSFTAFMGAAIAYVFELQSVELWIIIGIMVFLDVITGLIRARHEQELLSSRRMFDKLEAIAVYGVVIALANALINTGECTAGLPAKIGDGLRIAVVLWIISTEFKSIMENLSISGYKIPKKLEEAMQKFIAKK